MAVLVLIEVADQCGDRSEPIKTAGACTCPLITGGCVSSCSVHPTYDHYQIVLADSRGWERSVIGGHNYGQSEGLTNRSYLLATMVACLVAANRIMSDEANG